MNETEYSINNRRENQTVYNIYIYGDCLTNPTNDSLGTQGGICMQARADYPDQVHSDQMVFRIVLR
jgi:pyruvate/2-oxoglutarate dehydrogenase complex dihydrolipoamide dehydrogenase (E3) component